MGYFGAARRRQLLQALSVDGTLLRSQGWEEQGHYELLHLGDHVQINLAVDGLGTVISELFLGENPRALCLDHEGVFRGTYVFEEKLQRVDEPGRAR